MAAKKTSTRRRSADAETQRTTIADALRWLEAKGTKKQIQELDKYGIEAAKPFGVTVGDLKKYAKQIGTDHKLALELWKSGRYEARMLATMVDDPEQVTVAQMNTWAADFDNWAIVDTACFHLFDRTAHAWKKVPQWAKAKPEFTKRTAFALLWSLSVHDKDASDGAFQDGLKLIEKAADDEREYVKKAVNMALRAIGKRNAKLHAAALQTAQLLAKSEDATPRWIGSHALRELSSPAVRKRVGTKAR
ncbi:MAG: DNA alkylation repair protein [Planctomycetota bacterium]